MDTLVDTYFRFLRDLIHSVLGYLRCSSFDSWDSPNGSSGRGGRSSSEAKSRGLPARPRGAFAARSAGPNIQAFVGCLVAFLDLSLICWLDFAWLVFLVCWLLCWFVGLLVGCLVGWFVAWLVCWFVLGCFFGLLVGGLVACLVGFRLVAFLGLLTFFLLMVCWLVGWLVAWLDFGWFFWFVDCFWDCVLIT